MTSTRFTTRQLLIGVAMFCATIALLRFVVWPVVAPFTPGFWENVSDVYALWQTEEMISLHIGRHNGRLPGSWDDLQSEFDSTNQHYGCRDIASVKDRVTVDFEGLAAAATDPSLLDPATTPIIRLTKKVAKGNKRISPAELEVNQRLIDSLQARQWP